jgi:hypothetical protein
MSDLSWVSVGFVLVYGSMAAYLVALDVRRERARTRAGDE